MTANVARSEGDGFKVHQTTAHATANAAASGNTRKLWLRIGGESATAAPTAAAMRAGAMYVNPVISSATLAATSPRIVKLTRA